VPAGRAPFVLTVMVLLGVGLVATLWLSTAAAADSYRLQDARTAARELSERSERLHREVAALQSPPALAQRAARLGMVPVKDPARRVVGADGAVRVVGEPTPAVATAAVAPLPGGLDGGVAPTSRAVPAPESAPEDVVAAAVAAARPAVEQARKAAENAAAENGTDGPSQDGTAQDGTSQDGTAQDGTSQDGTSQDGTSQDGTSQDGAGQSGAGRSGEGRTAHDTSGNAVRTTGAGEDGNSAPRNTAAGDGTSAGDSDGTAGTHRAPTDAG
jgi:hypothetical protein